MLPALGERTQSKDFLFHSGPDADATRGRTTATAADAPPGDDADASVIALSRRPLSCSRIALALELRFLSAKAFRRFWLVLMKEARTAAVAPISAA